jgi:hypothetical protein
MAIKNEKKYVITVLWKTEYVILRRKTANLQITQTTAKHDKQLNYWNLNQICTLKIQFSWTYDFWMHFAILGQSVLKWITLG